MYIFIYLYYNLLPSVTVEHISGRRRQCTICRYSQYRIINVQKPATQQAPHIHLVARLNAFIVVNILFGDWKDMYVLYILRTVAAVQTMY